MKPVLTFGDPEAAIRAYLDAAFVGSLADRKPSKIATDPPSAPLGEATHVQVELDGTPSTADLLDRPTIRLNVSAGPGRRTAVKALASLVQGLVAAHPGDDLVLATRRLVGRSAVVTDPATKNLMVWMTFRVTLKPTKVAP